MMIQCVLFVIQKTLIFQVLFLFFIAKLSCLLLKGDDIRYHSQKFLVGGYIAFSKQELKDYYSKIDIYMLNSYPNFVVDQNSYMNEINFL